MDHEMTHQSGRYHGSDSEHHGMRRRHAAVGGFAAGAILLAWIAFGTIILLGSCGVINARISDLWPVILILAGANLLLCGGRYRMHTVNDQDDHPPMD
jgi:hypothetical protein